MTVDVRFGTLTDGDEGPWWEWPGKDVLDRDDMEDDGTSSEYTIFSGFPWRPYSTRGYYDFLRRVPIARAIHDLCKPLYPDSNDPEWRAVDRTLIDLIDQLPETDGACDADRAKWYKYWSRRAVESFGDKAVIFIS